MILTDKKLELAFTCFRAPDSIQIELLDCFVATNHRSENLKTVKIFDVFSLRFVNFNSIDQLSIEKLYLC